MTQLSVPETVTLSEAIALTQELLSLVEQGKLSDTEIETAIASLIKTKTGAQGWFGTYLTDNGTLAEKPTPAVFRALETSPEFVPNFLVKNVAMCADMANRHR
ncbi:MAG: hypothetical protein F6K35_45685, partial [Okeania sp. SIO2H7]|nr:hypothetical protein [Okeania sp. SIO2H7]